MSWIPWPQSSKSKKKHVVGITTRAHENCFQWLEDVITREYPDHIDVIHLPITNNNRSDWMEIARACSAVILYHTKHQGRVNITDVEGALYEEELHYLNNILGREKVVVLLDDMEDISEEERQRILRTQISLDRLSSHLILIPEKNKSETVRRKLTEFRTALSEGVKTSQKKESPGLFSSLSLSSIFSRSSGDTGNSDSKNNGKEESALYRNNFAIGKSSSALFKSSQSPRPPYQISIFSRSSESNYAWLINSLKEDDPMRTLDIKSVYITNDYETFRSGLQTCQFAILYHTRKQGRLNITDVADSLYDEELRDMSNFLGKTNVIVIADDAMSSEPEERERILTHQHSIHKLAKDLFLFTEEEKHTRNLETIKEMIQSQAQHNKGPNKEHRAAPPKEREPSKKNHGSSFDSHTDIITPNQVSAWDPSPSCSGVRTSRWESGDAEHYDTISNNKGAAGSTSGKSSASPSPPYRIGIFSRCGESNYSWLSDRLKEDDHMRLLVIKSVCITNDDKTFRSGLETCRFAILYHTLKHGRLNITNVANSLYDKELRDMSHCLGRENVIVVADDLMSSEPEDKEQIRTKQPSIPTYAKDLFLFTEHEKNTRNLEKIREIIRRSQAQHNNHGSEHRAAPHRDGESAVRISGSSAESLKNRMTPDQEFTSDSSSSHSGSQKSDIVEPHSKRPKTSSEQTNSMEEKRYLSEASPSDLFIALNKKLWDLQQENQELRNAKFSHEDKIKELENSVILLTLENNRLKELNKKIQRGVDGHGEVIRERENVLPQRATKGNEIEKDILPQEGGEGAHGHETPPLGRERFPEKEPGLFFNGNAGERSSGTF